MSFFWLIYTVSKNKKKTPEKSGVYIWIH